MRSDIEYIEMKLVSGYGLLQGGQFRFHRGSQIGMRSGNAGADTVLIEAGVHFNDAEVRRPDPNMHFALAHALQDPPALQSWIE